MIARLTPLAESDVLRAFEYYEKEKPDLGYRFIARVDEAIELISKKPNLFAPLRLLSISTVGRKGLRVAVALWPSFAPALRIAWAEFYRTEEDAHLKAI